MKGCLVVVLLALGAFWYFGGDDSPQEKLPASVLQHPELKRLVQDADQVEVYTAEGETDLRGFISSLLAYQPWWLDPLYKVRAVLVRILGMKQGQVPTHISVAPKDIPMAKDQMVSIYRVVAAEEGSFWLVNASEKHLSAHVGVVMEPSKNKRKRFHLLIVVHYKNWAGPVYFNIIKPFERLYVKAMLREGAGGNPAP